MKSARILEIDDLVLDLAARRVFRGDEEIELGRLTFDLFAALAEAAPAALSADETIARVWGATVVSDDTLKQRVSLLRRALGQESMREYVQTVHGFGYRLGFEPVSVEPPASGAVASSEAARTGASPRSPLLRRLLVTLAIVTLLLMLALFGMLARQVKRWSPSSSASVEVGTESFASSEALVCVPADAERRSVSRGGTGSHRGPLTLLAVVGLGAHADVPSILAEPGH